MHIVDGLVDLAWKTGSLTVSAHYETTRYADTRKDDFYIDSEIVSIITSAGNLYSAHMKYGDYSV
jgi:hypothetical protein